MSPRASNERRSITKSAAYYSKAIVDSMMNDLRLGLSLSDTAYRHRTPVGAVYNWYSTNYEGFREEVDKATVDCKRLHLGRLVAKEASMVNVKASIFMLERKFRDEFGPTSQEYYSAKELQIFMLKVGNILTRHLAEVSPDLLKVIAEDISKVDVGRPMALGVLGGSRSPLAEAVGLEVELGAEGEIEPEV